MTIITPDYTRDSLFSEQALELFIKHYLIDGEKSPQDAFIRAAVAYSAGDADLASRIYDYVSRGWFMFASPVLSNAAPAGEKPKALPISCFLGFVGDSLDSLINHQSELAWLSVKGGGVGGHWGSVRAVSNKAPGPIPFIKVADSAMTAYRQGTCYTPDTEVMTDVGWVRFDELESSDKIGQVNPDLSLDFVRPIELVKEHHVGKIISVFTKDKSVDLMVTPNHSMVLERKRTKGWTGSLEKVRADLLPQHNEARFHTSVDKNGSVNYLTPEQRFLIAFQADGFYQESGCGFHIAKKRKIDRLTTILDECGYSYKKVNTPENTVKFYIHSPIKGNKLLDWIDWTSISSIWCEQFIEELSNWDSHVCGGNRGILYSSTVKQNADVVQAIAALANRTSRLSVDTRENEENKSTIYSVYIRTHNKPLLLESVKREYFDYSGYVYCAVVPTGMLLVRRNGVVTVCGNTRRGSYAAYLDISHPDIVEFLNVRVPTGGDPNRKAFNIHNAINITDKFMEAVMSDSIWELKCPASGEVRDKIKARDLWQRILETRFKTGEPYLNFIDTANKALPATQKLLGLKIHGSNLCNEIHLATSEDRTAVCCLSSVNIEKYDEWKDTNMVKDLIRFLDNVLQVFIDNCPPELAKAKYSAERERSLGLGAMGFHGYLQSKSIPFESLAASLINKLIFRDIYSKAVESSRELASERGEAPDMMGSGLRNAHLIAVAPNASSSTLLGCTPSIEPLKSNAFAHRTRVGTHLIKNKYLEPILEAIGKNTEEVWQSIILEQGSVQHLDFLSQEEKDVFKTAFELDQRWIVEHAADRQKFICQGQSVNLFFPSGSDRSYVNKIHLEAWQKGLKGLYYLRTESAGKAEAVSRKVERVALKSEGEGQECLSCSG